MKRACGLIIPLCGILVGVWLSACSPSPTLDTSYLAPYQAVLRGWTATEEVSWRDLPRYVITATLDIENLVVTGQETVRFTNNTTAPLKEICFRLYPNIWHTGSPMRVLRVKADNVPVAFDIQMLETVLKVDCDPPIAPGQVAHFTIDFSVKIPAIQSGWVLFGYSQNIWTLPNFFPVLSVYRSRWYREIPPPFADAGYAEASFYRVSLNAPADLVIANTGTIVERAPQPDGTVTTTMIAGPIREFAVVASADYQVVTTEVYGIEVRSFFLRGDENGGTTALWRGASALQVYSDMYGTYPFSIMSVAEAPLQFKGMEFSTLNLLGVDLYRAQRKDLSYLTVHEVAHQWWYGQVGNDPYEFPWLDEGLAEYSAYTYYWKTQGRKAAEMLRDERWTAPYEYAKATGADQSLAQPADAYLGPRIYETMVYAKGALFFDALRRAVGDELYYAILRDYVRRYRFRIATPEDFFIVAREISGRDMTPLLNEWILTGQ